MDEIELTTRRVADFLGFRHTWSVVRLIQRGQLPCERQRQCRGRVIYYPTSAELRAYIEAYDRTQLPRFARTFHGELPPQPPQR
jgi:hypothetical protein